MNVMVYTKPGCVQCNATYRGLDKVGLPYESKDISQDPEALSRIKALGFLQAPVVEVTYATGETDSWSGFRPDKISEHAEAIAA